MDIPAKTRKEQRRKLSVSDEDQILHIYENSRTTIPDIAQQFTVSRPTIYTAIERAKARRSNAGAV